MSAKPAKQNPDNNSGGQGDELTDAELKELLSIWERMMGLPSHENAIPVADRIVLGDLEDVLAGHLLSLQWQVESCMEEMGKPPDPKNPFAGGEKDLLPKLLHRTGELVMGALLKNDVAEFYAIALALNARREGWDLREINLNVYGGRRKEPLSLGNLMPLAISKVIRRRCKIFKDPDDTYTRARITRGEIREVLEGLQKRFAAPWRGIPESHLSKWIKCSAISEFMAKVKRGPKPGSKQGARNRRN